MIKIDDMNIELDSDLLAGFKLNIDTMLIGVLTKMLGEGYEGGEINAKLSIALTEREVYCDGEKQTVKVPIFANKVTGKLERKYSLDGQDGGDVAIGSEGGTIKGYKIIDNQLSVFEED